MHNTKLLQVLSTLSVKELREFQLHVNQFSDRDASKKLLAHLSTFVGKWEHKDLQLEVVGKKLEYEAPFKSLSNRASDLYKTLMKFLVIRKLYSDDYKFEQEFLELRIFEERGLSQLKNLKMARSLKHLEKAPVDDQWSALREMLLQRMAYYNMNGNKIESGENNIERCLVLIDQFTISSKLKYACEVLSRSQVLNKQRSNYNFLFQQMLSAKVNSKDSFQILYQSTFKALYTLEPENFRNALALLQENEKHLASEDRYKIFGYLINALAQGSKKQVLVYGQQLLKLYQIGLSSGLLIHDNKITRGNFLNIVEIACKISDLDFAEKFIAEYSVKLPEEDSTHTATLAEAIVLFTYQNFKEVLAKLNIVNFNPIDEKFRANVLLLCSIYEIYEDADPSWDRCKSFKMFVGRKYPMLSANFLAGMRNFSNFVQRLLQRKESRRALQQALSETDPIVMRSWLESKLQGYTPL